MTDPDLETRRRPVKPDAKITHDWSLPSSHPILDDPIVRARMAKAISQRQLEREQELKMRPARREKHNRAMAEQRAIDLGAIFDWRLDDGPGFDLNDLTPPSEADCSCGCGRGCDSDRGYNQRFRDAGLDHLEYYRRQDGQPVIVSQPYRPPFEEAKASGLVDEVERERGIRIVEINPLLSWHCPYETALVLWLPR